MPRRRLMRRIGFCPSITRFTPIMPLGLPIKEIILTLDELESLRLKDLLNKDQKEAAKSMKISQPTFHRLILEARKKVTDALINNKQIKIQGGDYKITEQPQPQQLQQPPQQMPGFKAGRGGGRGFRGGRDNINTEAGAGPGGFCVCPNCGNKNEKVPGWPCSRMKCRKCGALMIRG